MSLAARSLKINLFTIQTLDGSTSIDLAGSSSIGIVDYFESILSPCITLKAIIAHSTSLTNTLPIRGGEKVLINISTAFGDLSFEDERALYVYNVFGINTDSTGESFGLNLVSREMITNETSRCMSRYNGKIDDSVKRILKEVLKTEKFKPENILSTANTYSFIGNMKNAFSVIYWLCNKALPTQNSVKTKEVNKAGMTRGVSGYLFYENIEGFNFKSVESLVSRTNAGTSDLKNIPKYVYTQAIESNVTENEFKIINYSIDKNSDLIKALRTGVYSNITYFYNIYTNKLSIYQYKLKDEIQKASKLGTNSSIAVSEELGNSISRIFVRTSDVGVMDNNFTGSTFDEGQQRDIADIAKSTSRYNILFMQSLNMMVPCNVKLKVGDVIYVEFPKLEQKNVKEIDEEQSGLYLIAELRHHISPGNMVTSLKLIRDSYGVYGSENVV
jgi:hypothetical protein